MKTFKNDFEVRGCRVSEKYDGINVKWTGTELVTKNGKKIHAPLWFTMDLPRDKQFFGELFAGRGNLETVKSVYRKLQDPRWRDLRIMAFSIVRGRFCTPVDYATIRNAKHLHAIYSEIVDGGGEGVVIRGTDSNDYKMKPVQDSEGTVIEYIATKRHKIGSLLLRMANGVEFKVSSGLTRELRSNPPAIGSLVRFTYQGLTSTGKPRHASIVGIRDDITPEQSTPPSRLEKYGFAEFSGQESRQQIDVAKYLDIAWAKLLDLCRNIDRDTFNPWRLVVKASRNYLACCLRFGRWLQEQERSL